MRVECVANKIRRKVHADVLMHDGKQGPPDLPVCACVGCSRMKHSNIQRSGE